MAKSEEHQDSIYYFKRGEFKNYIQAIDNKSIPVSDAVATFREAKCLPNKFKQINSTTSSRQSRADSGIV